MPQIIKQGSRGLEVARIQAALNAYGANPKLTVDCFFGPATERAVRKFQSANGIVPDGIVGPLTRGFLYPFKTLTLKGTVQRGPAKGPQPNSSSASPSPSASNPTPPPPASTSSSKPVTSTPPPSSGGGQWVQQVQAGGQVAFSPWINTGSPQSTVWSGLVTMQFTYQTKPEGRHWEFSPLLQLAINSQSKPTDPLFTFSGGGQVTWADVFVKGSWHILSPFAQVMALTQVNDGKLQLGAQGSIGNQITFEAKKDHFLIFAQGALAGTYTNDGVFTLGPQISLGVIGQF